LFHILQKKIAKLAHFGLILQLRFAFAGAGWGVGCPVGVADPDAGGGCGHHHRPDRSARRASPPPSHLQVVLQLIQGKGQGLA